MQYRPRYSDLGKCCPNFVRFLTQVRRDNATSRVAFIEFDRTVLGKYEEAWASYISSNAYVLYFYDSSQKILLLTLFSKIRN